MMLTRQLDGEWETGNGGENSSEAYSHAQMRWMIMFAAIKHKAQKVDFLDFVPRLLCIFLNCDIIMPIFLYERGERCLLDVRRSLNR